MLIETPRLLLRRLEKSDLDDLHLIFSDPESMEHYPKTFSREKSMQWIEWNLENYHQLGYGLWAVVLKQSNLFVGDCGITIQQIDGQFVPEIGYHINKLYTKKGYATEAAKACRDYAFNVLKFPEIYSYMKYSNIASQKVAENLGMKLVSELKDDSNITTKVYSLSIDDYQHQKLDCSF